MLNFDLIVLVVLALGVWAIVKLALRRMHLDKGRCQAQAAAIILAAGAEATGDRRTPQRRHH